MPGARDNFTREEQILGEGLADALCPDAAAALAATLWRTPPSERAHSASDPRLTQAHDLSDPFTPSDPLTGRPPAPDSDIAMHGP